MSWALLAVTILATLALALASSVQLLYLESQRLRTRTVPVRVVGTVEHFPAASGDFVLGDEASLFVALNSASPGTTMRGGPSPQTA